VAEPVKLEIERRFLVRGDGWRREALTREHLRQGYLAADEQKVIRVRVAPEKGFLTIKQGAGGFARREFEYEIPRSEACLMVEEMSRGYLVEKIRHRIGHAGKVWEVDEFLGSNQGLVVAEIELERADESFEPPPWLGREITGEGRFSNAALSRQPFCLWPDRDSVAG
jgi:adenylate cyclase